MRMSWCLGIGVHGHDVGTVLDAGPVLGGAADAHAQDELRGHRDAGHADLGAAGKQSRIGDDAGAADGGLDPGGGEKLQELLRLGHALARDAGPDAEDDLRVLQLDAFFLLGRDEPAREAHVPRLHLQHLGVGRRGIRAGDGGHTRRGERETGESGREPISPHETSGVALGGDDPFVADLLQTAHRADDLPTSQAGTVREQIARAHGRRPPERVGAGLLDERIDGTSERARGIARDVSAVRNQTLDAPWAASSRSEGRPIAVLHHHLSRELPRPGEREQIEGGPLARSRRIALAENEHVFHDLSLLPHAWKRLSISAHLRHRLTPASATTGWGSRSGGVESSTGPCSLRGARPRSAIDAVRDAALLELLDQVVLVRRIAPRSRTSHQRTRRWAAPRRSPACRRP